MARASKPAPATKALANWDDELAKYATEAAASEQTSGGKFLSTKGGILSFGGAAVPGNVMNVIVLDHILENHRYTERFDPDSPASPICYAFGRTDEEMQPHENCSEPQSDSCVGCPLNEWASADTGRGKACKNIRRLALIPEDGLDDLENCDIAFLKVPVTSVKNWAGYVQAVATQMKRPPFAVITEISVVPDNKTQFAVKFKVGDKIEDPEVLKAILARRAAVADSIAFPYAKNEDRPASAPTRGASKFAPKAAAKVAPKVRGR